MRSNGSIVFGLEDDYELKMESIPKNKKYKSTKKM